MPEETREEERVGVANRALNYLTEHDSFDLAEFQQSTFDGPESAQQFSDFKASYEEENGTPIQDAFTVSKTVAANAKKKLTGRIKLDTGVDIRVSPGFVDESERFLERGFDADKHMRYIKIYYHDES